MKQPQKILIVDDNASLVHLYQVVFERAGFAVQGATSAQEALDLIDAEMPDLILLDIMMPEIDGLELCRMIRAQYQSAAPLILIYTADSRQEVYQESLAAGANGFLTKNSSIFALPAAVQSYLKQQAS